MGMWNNVISAPKKLVAVDCSLPDARDRVVELSRCAKRSSARLLFLIVSLLSVASQTFESRAEEGEARRFNCSAQDQSDSKAYRLIQYLGSNKNFGASWGEEFRAGQYASCGFTDGRRFSLTDVGLFIEKSAVVDKSVAVYRGIGDHCSEGKLLIFNERTKLAMIIAVQTLDASRFRCSLLQ
jgi:hypothetical protein